MMTSPILQKFQRKCTAPNHSQTEVCPMKAKLTTKEQPDQDIHSAIEVVEGNH